MFEATNIINKEEKSFICETILRALPRWFGIEDSIIEYIKTTKEMTFFAVNDGSIPVGFVAIKIHNQYTAEVYVIGVLREYHRKGIGRILLHKCEEFCKENGMEFLTVKTLDESRPSKSYEKTRLFYTAMGFRPVEVFKELWDEDNPCLLMAKYLRYTQL